MALAANVSYKTVSRVINHAPHVSQQVTERVERAIRQLGYRPNPAARALATRRTFTLGLLYSDDRQYETAIRITAYEQAARAGGYGLLMASVDSSPGRAGAAVEHLRSRGVEGIVCDLSVSGALDPDDLSDLPFVSGTRRVACLHRQAVVAVDQVEGARTATQHLLGLGHTTVAHLGGPLSSPAARLRRRGWAEALHECPGPPPLSGKGDWSAQSGYLVGRQLLTSHPDLTAVFAANDEMAIGLMRAAAEFSVSVPLDLSVVGMGDIPIAAYETVPLSTVATNPKLVADRSVPELIRLVEGHAPLKKALLISPQLISRASSTTPRPGSLNTRRSRARSGAHLTEP